MIHLEKLRLSSATAGMTAGIHRDATILTLGGGTTYRKILARGDWS